MDEDPYDTWHADAELLAEIGRHLFTQQLQVTVRLPANLAERALASWQRDERDGALPVDETESQRLDRRSAGAVGLIGLSIESRSAASDDVVTVQLNAWEVGLALEAADERGLLDDVFPPRPLSRPGGDPTS